MVLPWILPGSKTMSQPLLILESISMLFHLIHSLQYATLKALGNQSKCNFMELPSTLKNLMFLHPILTRSSNIQARRKDRFQITILFSFLGGGDQGLTHTRQCSVTELYPQTNYSILKVFETHNDEKRACDLLPVTSMKVPLIKNCSLENSMIFKLLSTAGSTH